MAPLARGKEGLCTQKLATIMASGKRFIPGCGVILGTALLMVISVKHISSKKEMLFSLGHVGIVSNQSIESQNKNSKFSTVIPKNITPYRPFFNRSIKGELLNIPNDFYKRLLLPTPEFVEFDTSLLEQLVFVMYSSDNHWEEGKGAIACVQQYFPGHKIVFYDLGLNDAHKKELKRVCKVEYRMFDFQKYPAHLRNLQNYAWKPMVVLDMIKEHPAIFWMDTSVRWLTSNLTLLKDKLSMSKGLLFLDATGFGTFETIEPGMYKYLPTDIQRLQKTEQFGGGVGMALRTQQVFEEILNWWFLCALDRNCIHPKGSRLGCSFKNRKNTVDAYKFYASCHRFDQSAINILLSNFYNFSELYQYRGSPVLTVKRSIDNRCKIQYCD